jgi:hypothetical protein
LRCKKGSQSFFKTVGTNDCGGILIRAIDLQKGGLDSDLQTLADGLHLAGLLPTWNGHESTTSQLQDASFVQAVQSLLAEFEKPTLQNGFAAAASVSSDIAMRLTGESKLAVSAIASVLGDVAQMFAGNSGPGNLVKDAQYVESAVTTYDALYSLGTAGKGIELKALGQLVDGLGDVVGILSGFQQGGVLGGVEAGTAPMRLQRSSTL